MTTNVSLTPELDAFARSCVETGRYGSVSEVVRSGLRLLQERELRREKFNAMLEAVRAETAREGAHELDAVLREIDGIVG